MTATNNITAGIIQTILRPFPPLYGVAAFSRRRLYAGNILKTKRLSCPVISIGNITTGGTGKTPMTIYIAMMLKKAGFSPLIVSRGYRGGASKKGGIVSDGKKILMDVGESGDEPLLMAERLAGVPLAVGQDRYKIATSAIRQFSPDMILLDDGFQHFQLARDMDIVLLDNARPLGNNYLLPAGPLREPLAALQKADVIVFTRSENPKGSCPDALERYISGKPRFNAYHVPVITEWIAAEKPGKPKDRLPDTDALAHCRAYVFCGLANNQSFLDGIGRLTADVAGYRFFRDHHVYTAGDLAAISRAAESKNADIIITSRKDYVKFRDRPRAAMSSDLAVLDAAISFKDRAAEFNDLLLEMIRRLETIKSSTA